MLMKIAYVTAYDILNVRKVNGAGRFIAESLIDRSIELEYIDLRNDLIVSLAHGTLKAKELLHNRFQKTVYVYRNSRLLARLYGRRLAARLRRSDADLVFSPIAPGSFPISYLDSERPIAVWTDATYAGVLNFYPGFSNMAPQTIRDGLANERAAFERVSLAIFSSDWAARTAIEHYGVSDDRVWVVPYGPYTHDLPSLPEVQRMIQARAAETARCKLLFLGRDWRRKGGDVALEVAHALRAMGVEAELTFAGSYVPRDTPLPEYVKALGYLNKSDAAQRATLSRLFAESHFLILPTRADCAPAAVREASAYGLPCVTSDVGGLTTLVNSGHNGQTFALDAGAGAYARYIAAAFGDPDVYRQLGQATIEEYRARLNWQSAGRTVRHLLEQVAAGRAPALSPAAVARV